MLRKQEQKLQSCYDSEKKTNKKVGVINEKNQRRKKNDRILFERASP